jgi:ankyrin repeat protein
VENRAEVDATDMQGKTALTWAALQGHGDVVSCLLYHAANAQQPDEDGNTPLDWASFEGHRHVMELLLEVPCRGFRPSEFTGEYVQALSAAC